MELLCAPMESEVWGELGMVAQTHPVNSRPAWVSQALHKTRENPKIMNDHPHHSCV